MVRSLHQCLLCNPQVLCLHLGLSLPLLAPFTSLLPVDLAVCPFLAGRDRGSRKPSGTVAIDQKTESQGPALQLIRWLYLEFREGLWGLRGSVGILGFLLELPAPNASLLYLHIQLDQSCTVYLTMYR